MRAAVRSRRSTKALEGAFVIRRPMITRHPEQTQAGVTVVDLMLAVVVVGILAAFAAPRFFDDKTFLERGYYEELTAALKYAQKLAVASGCPVRMQVTSAGYLASQPTGSGGPCDAGDDSATKSAQVAAGQLLSGTTPIGVSTSPNVTVTFDAFGRTDLASDQSISVGPFALTLRADDGYVQAP